MRGEIEITMIRKTVLVTVAPGFEDIETVAPIDVLTRCGASVTLAAPKAGPVKGAWGATLTADCGFEAVNELFDAIVVPGGLKNAIALAAEKKIVELLRHHFSNNRLVASICASPSHVLGESACLLKGRQATGDPAFDDRLAAAGAILTGRPIAIDGNLITASGPGSALQFALTIAEALGYQKEARSLREKWQFIGIN